MKNEVYGIYDLAAECYVQTVSFQNEATARMSFAKLFKERRIQIPLLYDYPNVYQVSKLAEFDDNTGLFTNIDNPELLLNFGSLSADKNDDK